MSGSSGTSFHGFDLEDIRNLPAMEGVTGNGSPQSTSPHANTDPDQAMVRQGSASAPPRGDWPADQADLIRTIIREELRRGAGRRSRRSGEEDSGSSPSSQEGHRSSRSSHSRSRSVRRSRSPFTRE